MARRYGTRRKSSLGRKLLISLLVIILVAIGGGYIYYRVIMSKVIDKSIDFVSKDTDVYIEDGDDWPIYLEDSIDSNVINILLIGSDSRDLEVDSGRSDSMMLLSYNKKNGNVVMASFLRDSLVYIEGYGTTRLNHAYAYGGVGLTINTINETYDLDIQNYIIVNFDNLERIVDSIGGVEVALTDEEISYIYERSDSLYLTEGVNKLDGETALIHARNRYVGTDFERTRRQRDIMMGIFGSVKQVSNPFTLASFVNTCANEVKTNLGANDMLSLATKALVSDLDIQQLAIPADGTWYYAQYQGMSIIEFDEAENRWILYDMIYNY